MACRFRMSSSDRLLSCGEANSPLVAVLGWFEAAAIPTYSVITISFWRRSEQPLRVAAWYGTNGIANIIASPIVFGCAKATNASLDTYQIVYCMRNCPSDSTVLCAHVSVQCSSVSGHSSSVLRQSGGCQTAPALLAS